MFYIKLFYKIIFNNFASGIPFLILTNILLVSSAQFQYAEEVAARSFPAEKGGDYFYALIVKEESISWISRKIKGLPGVARCQKISEQEIKEELSTIMSEIGEDLEIELNYGGVKVHFSDGIEARSKKLIREYLVRLVGREKVTLGPIKKIEVIGGESDQFLRDYIGYGILILMGIFWMFLIGIVRKNFAEQAYLIGNFQQRKSVLPKIMLVGLGVNILLVGLIQIFIGPINIYIFSGMALFMIVVAAISSRSQQWSG